MSYEPESYPPLDPDAISESPAAGRLTLPAIFLLVVGAVNLIGGIGLLIVGFFFMSLPPEQFEKMMRDDPGQRQRMETLKKEGWSMQDVLNIYIRGGLGGGAVGLVGAVLTLAGAVCMFMRKARGLAILGSVAAAIPVVSCLGCCGVGEIVGIWAIVVLMNEEVKRAFT